MYGTDDRREVFEEGDPAFRSLASNASLMTVLVDDVGTTQGGMLVLDSRPLGSAYDLCPGERFVDQPSVGVCSATLVEPDLVLTAGHCLTAVPCEQWAVVRGFQYDAPSTLKSLGDEDLRYCAGVIAARVDAATDERRIDYAWVRLDRPFEGAGPLPRLDRSVLDKDAAVIEIGHPMGIPSKIDDGGWVLDPRAAMADYFVTSTDSFVGDSGAGVFDENGSLRGISVRGSDDFTHTNDGCFQTVVRAPQLADEKATYIGPALDELCAQDGSWLACAGSGYPLQSVASCSVTARRSDTSRRTPVGAVAFVLLAWRSRRRRIARLARTSESMAPCPPELKVVQ